MICDNLQQYGVAGQTGFDTTPANRANNWSQFNWTELAQSYRSGANPQPVAVYQWQNDTNWRSPTLPLPSASLWTPGMGVPSGATTLWSRYFFLYNGNPMYLSYPVFESPLTSGRIIDMKNGVWENGSYTGRKVKTIVMPTLNNHSSDRRERGLRGREQRGEVLVWRDGDLPRQPACGQLCLERLLEHSRRQLRQFQRSAKRLLCRAIGGEILQQPILAGPVYHPGHFRGVV